MSTSCMNRISGSGSVSLVRAALKVADAWLRSFAMLIASPPATFFQARLLAGALKKRHQDLLTDLHKTASSELSVLTSRPNDRVYVVNVAGFPKFKMEGPAANDVVLRPTFLPPTALSRSVEASSSELCQHHICRPPSKFTTRLLRLWFSNQKLSQFVKTTHSWSICELSL